MKYKTVQDLISKLGISKQAVYKAISEGKIKTRTVLGRKVFTEKEFNDISFEQKPLVRWIVKK